jgi:hypothetical protein
MAGRFFLSSSDPNYGPTATIVNFGGGGTNTSLDAYLLDTSNNYIGAYFEVIVF